MNQSHTELAARQCGYNLGTCNRRGCSTGCQALRLMQDAAALDSPERVLGKAPVGYVDAVALWLRQGDDVPMSIGIRRHPTPCDVAIYTATPPTAPAQDARQADEALMRQAAEALEAAKFVLDAAIGMHLVRVPEDADGPVVQIPEAITALRARLETSNA